MGECRFLKLKEANLTRVTDWYRALSPAQQKVLLFLLLLVAIRGPFYLAFIDNDWKDGRKVPYWVVVPVVLGRPSPLR
jgi:hypothetical protein